MDRLRFVRTESLGYAAAAIALGTLVGAVNSFIICGASRFMSFRAFLRTFWLAWAVGLVLPGQVGDMLTITQALRRHGMPLSQSIARTSVDKVISLVCSLLVASQIYRLGNAPPLLLFSAGALSLLGCIVFALVLSVWMLQRLERAGHANRWIVGATATAAEIRHVVTTHPVLVLLNFLLSALKIGLTGISYWVVIGGLSVPQPSFLQTTIAAVSSGLVAYLPLSANGVGTVEMLGSGLFGVLGMNLETVLSMYILLRLLNIVLAWLPAAFLLPDLLRRPSGLNR